MIWLVWMAWVVGLIATKEVYGLGSWGLYLLGSTLFAIWVYLKTKDLNN